MSAPIDWEKEALYRIESFYGKSYNFFMQKGDHIILKPQSLSSDGEGVAKVDGLVVFVHGALPQEEVVAEITDVRKNFAKARTLQVKIASPQRVKPPCPVFGRCGGCQLQHLSYPGQLEAKRQRVLDALERIGGLHGISVSPCIPSPFPYEYRNKVQLPVLYTENGIRLGLYAAQTHDIVPVDACLITCQLGETIFRRIQNLAPPQKGKIRYFLIKCAVNTNEALVVLVTSGLDAYWLKQFAANLMQQLPEVRGVVENINTREDNVILGDRFQTIAGEPFIEEELCGKRFRISPHSFFQVNTYQAEQIFQKVLELSGLDRSQTLIDAYCGVGTFSIIASDHAQEVIGIECVPLAIEDANANAALNGATNCRFICGTSERELPKHKADVIFVNPPRKGCDSSLIDALMHTAASRLIYMSCNPATLARDLEMLRHKYTIKEVIPFDMFPQTTHVETVVLLEAQN